MSQNDVLTAVLPWAQLFGVGLMFPFAGYFFKKNERLHEETQKSQKLQDIRINTLEIQIAVLYQHLKIPQPIHVTNAV